MIKSTLFTESADKSMGTTMRRLSGNAESRAPLMDMLESIDSVSKKYGGKFDDDLYLLQFVANEMDDVLNVAAKTSIKGEMGAQAMEAAGRSTAANVAKLPDAAKRILGMKSEEKALNALQVLAR